MTETPTTRPSFFGGVAEHLLFVVALCRLEHHSLPLALLHYATWSVVGVAMHVLAFTVGGPPGPVVLALALTAWALRFDVPVGIFFGLMQAAFAWATLAIVRERLPASGVATSGLALAAIVAAIVTEVSGHHVFQGYGPPPPARIIAGFSRRQQAAFVPYFVVTFGLFFLTLDLAMRLLGYRRDLNGRANAVAVAWHEGIVGAAGELGTGPRELQLHRRAIAELS